MDFQIRLPITTYQDVRLTGKDLIEILEQEIYKMAKSKGFDTIAKEKDGYYYYERPGSHRREVYGDKLEGEELEDYLALHNTIKLIRRKYVK